MVRLTWEVRWAAKLRKSLSSIEIDNANAERLKKATILVQGKAIEEAPAQTWALRWSIQYKVNRKRWVVYTTSPYWVFVHEWTNPYTIRVKNAKVLTNGKQFFWTVVRHPWIKSNPFFDRAVEKNKWRVKELYIRTLEKFIDSAF